MWWCVLACGASAQEERCDDVSAQIETALQNNIDKGILVGTAVGCELTVDSFDPRVQAADLEYLLNAFQNACAIQARECSGIPTRPIPPPPASSPTPGLPPTRNPLPPPSLPLPTSSL